jgi:hypothetical protein
VEETSLGQHSMPSLGIRAQTAAQLGGRLTHVYNSWEQLSSSQTVIPAMPLMLHPISPVAPAIAIHGVSGYGVSKCTINIGKLTLQQSCVQTSVYQLRALNNSVQRAHFDTAAPTWRIISGEENTPSRASCKLAACCWAKAAAASPAAAAALHP